MADMTKKSDDRKISGDVTEEVILNHRGRDSLDKNEKPEKSFYSGFMSGVAVGICLGMAIAHF